MINSFERYKEPIKIKEIIINLCKDNGFITTSTLKEKMKYKHINSAIKWIKIFEKEGLLKCIKEYHYSGRRNSAKYILNSQII